MFPVHPSSLKPLMMAQHHTTHVSKTYRYFVLRLYYHLSLNTIKMSSAGGHYEVTESGVHFRHEPALPTPKDGQEFLERFQ